MSELVEKLESLLTDQPHNPLRPHQVEIYQDEMERLEKVVSAPSYVTGADRGGAAKRRRELKTLMEQQVPKKISDARRQDDVARLSQEILETVIKRAILALHHDNRTEQSLASVEPFRPEGSGPGAATFMADAQIPGHFAMSQQAKDHWPLGAPTAKTQYREAAEVHQEEQFVTRMKRQMTMSEAERKAWGQKMQAARKAKRA